MMVYPSPMLQAAQAKLGEDLPRFTAHNWADFSVKWGVWVHKFEELSGPMGPLKFLYLEQCGDEGLRAEVQARREAKNLSYPDLWNWLEQRYGGDSRAQVRADLMALKPSHDGHMTLASWSHYTSLFNLYKGRLPGFTEDEAWNLILSRIPDAIRQKVIREDELRQQRRPMALVGGLRGFTLQRVEILISKIAGLQENFRVTPMGEDFLVHLSTTEDLNTVLCMNGKKSKSGRTPNFHDRKEK